MPADSKKEKEKPLASGQNHQADGADTPQADFSCIAPSRRCAPAVLVLFLSLLLTIAAFVTTRILERHRLESEFNEIASRPAIALQESIELNIGEIESIGSFYAASQFVERGEFKDFVKGILSRRQAIAALAWVPRVPQEERDIFEALGQGEMSKDFQISEKDKDGERSKATPREVYYPVWYIEPAESQTLYLGLDIASNPIFLEAISKARKMRRVIATRSFLTNTSIDGEPCVAVLLPIYVPNGSEPSVQTNNDPYGFVLGVFRISSLVDHAAKRIINDDIDIYLREVQSGPANRIIYSYPTSRETSEADLEDSLSEDRIEFSEMIHFAGSEWLMTCHPTERYLLSRRSRGSWIVLGFGLLFSILLTAYVVSILGRAAWAEQLVAERTKELSQSNERLQQEIRVRRLTEESLAIRNRELESFVYTASHDLRTPLVAIEGFARLLNEDYAEKLDESGREYVSRVLDSAQNMNALLTDLLELSRISSTTEPEESVSLKEVITQVLQDLEPIIAESDASIVLPESLPTLKASPTRLRQVFANFITNAIKFSRKGVAPQIEITCEKFPSGYRFLIKDNGIGIPQDQYKKVFEIFSRLKDKDVPGTGVGLAIVQRIIADHGGEVGLESKEGEGSTFWFTLPESKADK